MQAPPSTRAPSRLGGVDQLAQQPRLADPRLAGEEDERRRCRPSRRRAPARARPSSSRRPMKPVLLTRWATPSSVRTVPGRRQPVAAPATLGAPWSPDGVFVTGTGTEVGKTVVAAVIARTAATAGARWPCSSPPSAAWTSSTGRGRPRAAAPGRRLARRRTTRSPLTATGRRSRRISAPSSPARPIDPGRLRRAPLGRRRGAADFLVAEGVGGFLVPLTADYLVRDLARDLGLPVVIAAVAGPRARSITPC